MLYFSSGSLGLNFDLGGCAEVVAMDDSKIRQLRRFVVEVVDDFIAWLER